MWNSASMESCRTLSLQQRVILQTVKNHLNKSAKDQLDSPLRINISGSAGTGKSLICLQIRELLENYSKSHADFGFIIAAYTGIAAHQIRGETLHHAFGIPIFIKEENYDDFISRLDVGSVRGGILRKAKVLLFDEMSFIGQRMFYFIDRILKKYTNSYRAFGGKSVILVGDIYQLGPVGDRSLFVPAEKSHCKSIQESYKLYRSIDTTFVLMKPFRQYGNTIEQKEFQDFLGRLRKGECSEDDVQYARGRLRCNLSEEEQARFEYELHAFPRRAQVALHNWSMLRRQFAEHERVYINNQDKTLELAVGCPVILTRNLDVHRGLCNGSRGIVEEIEMSKEGSVRHILVSFPDYTGSYEHIGSTGKRGICIYRMREDVYCHEMERYMTVQRFPLELCYALTVHRIQGLTLPTLAFYLGPDQMFPAMDFISFSRTRTMQDIMIVYKDLPSERLKCNRKPMIQNWEEGRLMSMERIDMTFPSISNRFKMMM